MMAVTGTQVAGLDDSGRSDMAHRAGTRERIDLERDEEIFLCFDSRRRDLFSNEGIQLSTADIYVS
jgi:hypothetical protein